MEWKIGEIKQVNGEWYQCLEGNLCTECAFRSTDKCHLQHCTPYARIDKTLVIYQKLEKIGEPVTSKGRTFQKLRMDNPSCEDCCFNIPNQGCYKNVYIEGVCHYNDLWVEIKQTKEDMEEKNMETSNLKPFNLEAAKSGKPVCTRDGRKARIICFDFKNGEYPIVAAIENNSFETLLCYTINGEVVKDNYKSEKDLMMLPEKKEGWVNIYRGQVYNAFEKAEEARKIAEHGGDNCLKTIKIDWEE